MPISKKLVLCVLGFFFAITSSDEICLAANVYFSKGQGLSYPARRTDVDTPRKAVLALLAGPTNEEIASGASTLIPAGTTLIGMKVLPNGVQINLSVEAAKGLDEDRSETMFRQFFWTMEQFGKEGKVEILIDGKGISSYLKSVGSAIYSAPSDAEVAKRLSSKKERFVAFFDQFGQRRNAIRDGASKPQEAILLLLAGPTPEEVSAGISSAIAQGTRLVELKILKDVVIVNLSSGAAKDLDELRMQRMFKQVFWTIQPFNLKERVQMQIEGKDPVSYLPPLPNPKFAAATDAEVTSLSGSSKKNLSDKRITISCVGGYFWDGTKWEGQSFPCSTSEREEFCTVEIGGFLKTLLENDGAYVQPTREHRQERTGKGFSGNPWWQEAAYVWLLDQGYQCEVYANWTSICNTCMGPKNRLNDDIRSRPLASNLDAKGNTNVYVSLNLVRDATDSFDSGSVTDSIAYFCGSGAHASWGTQSAKLAQSVRDAQVSAVQAAGLVYGTAGAGQVLEVDFADVRIPARPATMIEIGCPNLSPKLGKDGGAALFKAASAWGIYDGLCRYFGRSATYKMFDSEMVSNTFPLAMRVGERKQVSLTFRNRGISWSAAGGVSLGAVGGSDPFAPPRFKIADSVVVGLNDTYTWELNLLAPDKPGTYKSNWQIVREGFPCFGATFSKDIQVTP